MRQEYISTLDPEVHRSMADQAKRRIEEAVSAGKDLVNALYPLERAAQDIALLASQKAELLEALEGAQRALARRIETDLEEKVSTCVSSRGLSGNPDCTCGFCERVKAEANARAAIAKARGET